MLMSILAGMMIAIGVIINLKTGGIAGAVFFAIGLLSVLCFKMELFTGKAGLLATKEIRPFRLFSIWIDNFIGVALIGLSIKSATSQEVLEKCRGILEIRISNGFWLNIIFGILCGILMYVAVTGYK